MKTTKLLLLAVIVAAIAGFFAFDLGQYLNLQTLQEQQQALRGLWQQQPLLVFASFFVIYVLATALSLPGATVLTLATGSIMGFGWGLLLASFASSIGAFLAFLSARFILRDWVQAKFSERLKAINQGMEKDGAFYLLTLRLVPIFPFFVINLVMGLTTIRGWTYYWVSQLGMLAGTAVYVNAGTQLGEVSSVGDIFSADLILSFCLLGVFPLLAKWVVSQVRRRRAYKGWRKPKQFDANLVVIGAGSAGLVSAYIAAAVKAKVVLIEKADMGGDCLNTGCVPSKALLHVAKTMATVRKASEVGITGVQTDKLGVDFGQVMQQVKQVIARIEPHDSVERYQRLGVDVVQGTATIESPWQVNVTTAAGEQQITSKAMVIAAGAKPIVPPIPGLAEAQPLTSDNLWNLTELPPRLAILGGGPIGCEMAQAFARLGSQVTVVEMQSQLLAGEDADTAVLADKALQADGVTTCLGYKAVAVSSDEQGYRVQVVNVENENETQDIVCDRILVAVGRQANLQGYGLEKLGIAEGKTLVSDAFLQTQYPNIYAAGDVTGPFQLTHAASHQAWYASVNALFAPFKRFRADYSVIPRVTYTSPEIASVGLTEKQAQQQHIDYEVSGYDLAELDRAIAERQANGRIKVLTAKGKDKVLGVSIVADQAGELLAEWVLAMKQGVGLNKILGTIHSYPTLAEANKYVAGEWKRAHAPESVLRWVERFHRWRRGGR